MGSGVRCMASVDEERALKGFTADYCRRRTGEVKTAMYQPVLADAQAMIQASRYYSALQTLERLYAIFPEKSDVYDLIVTCRSHVPNDLVIWTDMVEHLVLKPLIANRALAYDGDEFAEAADAGLILPEEFRSILEQLNQNITSLYLEIS